MSSVKGSTTTTRVVVASTVMLSFISFWRGAAIVLSERALRTGAAVGIGAVTLGLLLSWKRLPEPVIVLAAGIVGVLVAI